MQGYPTATVNILATKPHRPLFPQTSSLRHRVLVGASRLNRRRILFPYSRHTLVGGAARAHLLGPVGAVAFLAMKTIMQNKSKNRAKRKKKTPPSVPGNLRRKNTRKKKTRKKKLQNKKPTHLEKKKRKKNTCLNTMTLHH